MRRSSRIILRSSSFAVPACISPLVDTTNSVLQADVAEEAPPQSPILNSRPPKRARLTANSETHISNISPGIALGVPLTPRSELQLVRKERDNALVDRAAALAERNAALCDAASYQRRLRASAAKHESAMAAARRSRTRIENIEKIISESNSELDKVRLTLARRDRTRDQLRKNKKMLQMRDQRKGVQVTKRIERVRLEERAKKLTVQVKGRGGVVTNVMRDLACELVSNCKVSAKRVTQTIQTVSEKLGIEIVGNMSTRTVGRTVLEGGIISQLQISDAIRNASSMWWYIIFKLTAQLCVLGITTSSDGTGHKHLQYLSQHLYVTPNDGGAPRKFFCGISRTVNHTSQSQLEQLVSLIESLVSLWNSSPEGSGATTTAEQFISMIRGMLTDHAEDQKKLARLVQSWVTETRQTLKGAELLMEMPPSKYLVLLCEEIPKLHERAGGYAPWMELTAEQQAQEIALFRKELAKRLGAEFYDRLSPEQRRGFDFFVWAGCDAHKEMNAVKGGCAAFQAYWESVGHQPMLLPNKANAATIAIDDVGPAGRQARDSSTRGGVRLLTLCGNIVQNKHDDGGQHDSTKVYFRHMLGTNFSWTGTSNTRYQSYAAASSIVMVHLATLRGFIAHIRDIKGSGTFTNIEQNVYEALDDVPTLTEVAILALYHQLVSVPYMRYVRGSGKGALELGPWNSQTVQHIAWLAENPIKAMSTDEDTYYASTLDGKCWDDPNVIQAVQNIASRLPDLCGAFVAFMRGVHTTFVRFTAEFSEGGTIDTMTEAEHASVFLPSTNCANEGELGSLRNALRRFGNIGLLRHNAAAMYSRNETAAYIHGVCQDTRKWARGIARTQDASQAAAKIVAAQAQHDIATAAANREHRKKQAAKKKAKEDELDALPVELWTANDVVKTKLNKAPLLQHYDWYQLWHRRNKTDAASGEGLYADTMTAKSNMNKAELKVALAAAISACNGRHLTSHVHSTASMAAEASVTASSAVNTTFEDEDVEMDE